VVQWLVTDQLGTPRMVFDKTGSLATTKRHDYLPFGEELFAGTDGRTTTQGYTGDAVRQQFTQKERDIETGLDYFSARYYASTMGRFTSPDEFTGGPHEVFGDVLAPTPLLYAEPTEPQSLTKYTYSLGNPLRYVDPDGHQTKQSDALIVIPPATALNVAIGALKAFDNMARGINNFEADAGMGNQRVPLHRASDMTQGMTMVFVEDVSVFGGLLSGKPQAGVMVADSEESAVIAAEVGNSTRGASVQTPKEGIYEFPDAQNPGRTYVGQSGNMPQRLGTHGRTGRLAAGENPSTTSVGGGRIARETAEQTRINQLGGTRSVPGSRTSNIRNPVSRQRQRKLDNQSTPTH